MVYYHVLGRGKLMAAQYQEEMSRSATRSKPAPWRRIRKSMASLEPSKDPVIVAQGKETFSSCARRVTAPTAAALVGPNLCDDYWIHGSNFVDNLRTIWNGVPSKGMVTWKATLNPDTIYAAGSYIYTFRGTHPEESQTARKPGPGQDRSERIRVNTDGRVRTEIQNRRNTRNRNTHDPRPSLQTISRAFQRVAKVLGAHERGPATCNLQLATASAAA